MSRYEVKCWLRVEADSKGDAWEKAGEFADCANRAWPERDDAPFASLDPEERSAVYEVDL